MLSFYNNFSSFGKGNHALKRSKRCRSVVSSIALSVAIAASGTASAQVAETPAPQVPAQAGAPAQQDQDGSSFLGDIVVTAQKRSESSQRIPISVNAFSGNDLQRLGVTNVSSIATLVPGFTVAPSYRGPPIYTLRGVGFNTPNLSASSPVGVYVDEVAYPYPVMTEGLSFDLERVEVLKGPQGTLYGRNTTGGLINNIARKPTFNEDGYVRVSVGNYDSYGVEGAVGGGLTSNLAARLAFKLDKSDKGWQRSITRPDDTRGRVDKLSMRLGVLWQPVDTVDVNLTGTWWRDNSETTVGQSILIYPKTYGGDTNNPQWIAGLNAIGLTRDQIVAQAFNPTKASQANWVVNDLPWGGTVGGKNFTKPSLRTRKDNELVSLASRIAWHISDAHTLTFLTSYAKYNQDQPVDIAGWEYENALGQGIGEIKSFQQEVRLSGDTSRFKWIVGGFFGDDRIKVRDRSWGATINSLVGALRPIGAAYLAGTGASLAAQEDARWGFRDWVNSTDQHVTTYSAYGQADYEVATDLKLTAGLRYTKDKVTSQGCSRDQGDNSIAATWNAFFTAIGVPSNVAPGGCVTYLGDIEAPFLSRQDADPSNDLPFPGQGLVNKRLSQDNLAGRLALSYQVDPSALVYASATRGFKSGGVPTVDSNVGTQLNPVKQEELRAYEIGIKTKPLANTTFNVAGFYYDYRNKQVFGAVSDIIYGYLARLVNIPKSEIYGAEFELSSEVVRDVSVRLAGTYLHSKIKQYTGFDALGNVATFDGTSFTFTPELQLSGLASYRVDVGSNWESRFSVNGRYSSSQKGDLANNPLFRIKPFTVFDANINFASKDKKYEFELFIKNVFDKYYWNSVQTDQDSITRYAGMPRTYGAAFRVNF